MRLLLFVFMAGGLAAIGGVAAWIVLGLRLERRDAVLARTNVNGIEVPVVLGDALTAGALMGLAVLAAVELLAGSIHPDTTAVAAVVAIMWAAGAWDDRKGDERARGFRGHLGALKAMTVTGGIVKILGGAVAGLAAAALLPARGASPAAHVLETVALVALTANLVNLMDRAPGRAGKVSLLIGVPLAVAGDLQWALSVVPLLGALLFCMGPDLRERAMLGDAGANPLGAVLGLGFAASLGEPARLIAIAVLLVLNLASEKWSFSKAIEATPPLRWLDGLGRTDQLASK